MKNLGSGMTPIYLVCFHSATPETLCDSTGQYLIVEKAIQNGAWPYDNGDDPSFFVGRKGGPLTWGVCRQDLRNAIEKGSIVVFFSFTPLVHEKILYRLCAVTTVIDKVDHCAIYKDRRFLAFRDLYINALIVPKKDRWKHGETDRRRSQQHSDWLWRIADHRGYQRKEKFDKRYARIYERGSFSNAEVACRDLRLGKNYVVFGTSPDLAFIAPEPPEVAIARKGGREEWIDQQLRTLTVGTAASRLKTKRDYLRVANSSHRNVHRQIKFHMPTDEANKWRDKLIEALKESSSKARLAKKAHGTTVNC